MRPASASFDTTFHKPGTGFRNAGRRMNAECTNNIMDSAVSLTLEKMPLWFMYLSISFTLFYKGHTKACVVKKK